MDILVNQRKTDCFYHNNIKYLLCLFDYLLFQKPNLFFKKSYFIYKEKNRKYYLEDIRLINNIKIKSLSKIYINIPLFNK